MEKLHAHPNDPEHIGAQEEFLQIRRQIELEKSQPHLNMIQLLMSPRYRKRMMFGFYLQAMCQSTGVLVISNYMVLLLTNLGVTGSMPLLLLAVYNSWAAILNYVNALYIDRIGRRRIILIGLVSLSICPTQGDAFLSNTIRSEWLCPLSRHGDGTKRSLHQHRQHE